MIGEIVTRRTTRGQPGQVSGVLLPRPGAALPKSGSQHRIAMAGRSWVAELPMSDSDRPDRRHDVTVLEPHPPGTPFGIPQDEQLSIQSDGDELVHVRAISTLEHRLHPEHDAEEVAALPEGAVVNGSVWLVDLWLQSEAAEKRGK